MAGARHSSLAFSLAACVVYLIDKETCNCNENYYRQYFLCHRLNFTLQIYDDRFVCQIPICSVFYDRI